MQVKRSFSFKLVNRHADEGSGQLMGKEFFYHCLPFHRCIIARELTVNNGLEVSIRTKEIPGSPELNKNQFKNVYSLIYQQILNI